MLCEIEHVTKAYRGVVANDDVSLGFREGEVFGLLGPNGAGKTTLVGQILGLIEPTSGRITIDGVDVIRRPDIARRSCSYQPQSSVPIDGITPIQAIELAGMIRGGKRADVRPRARALIAALDLGEWQARNVPLSGGVARLVAFCMAAVFPGRIVILDEPTNDVDPLRRKLLWEQVRALATQGSAVLLVTHNVLEAERCVDRLAILDGGRVVASGSPGTLKAGLGGWLRLEVVLEPDVQPGPAPAFLEGLTVSGRRMTGRITQADVSNGIAWATALRDAGSAEEFSLGPATLEDVYVSHVTTSGGMRDAAHAEA
jgi:ABC-2 type transport system ATP-binding protein